MKCIYCFEEKPESEFTTVEHIIPQACDSDHVRDDIFLTNRVCDKCNHLCGLFVDGAFLKSWFINNDRSQNALYYLDKYNPGPIPFIYVGIYDKLSSDKDICEYWMDFQGNRIYHFHEPDERYLTYAGGNPAQRKRKGKAGSAFLIFSEKVADKPFWIISTIKSFEKYFKKETKYVLNCGVYDDEGNRKYVVSDDDSQEKQRRIESILDEAHKLSSRISLHAPTRFLSKISLGLGFTILGEQFLDSEYAKQLKDALWSFPEDKTPRLKGQTGLQMLAPHKQHMDKIFSWEGANSLILQKNDNSLGFHLYLFGKLVGTHPICDDISKYSLNIDINHDDSILGFDGIAFIWIPERDIPPLEISVSELIKHNIRKTPHAELLNLEIMRNDIGELLEIKEVPTKTSDRVDTETKQTSK